MYGCGDVIDDYVGIGGHESFRSHLRLLYLVSSDPARGEMLSLQMIAMRVRRMRLECALQADAAWLRANIEHVTSRFRVQVVARPDELLEATAVNG